MKKISVFLLILFIISALCVYADDENDAYSTEAGEEIYYYDDFDDLFDGTGKKPFGFGNRYFEMGIKANAYVSNNFLTVGEIFSETIVLDIDKLNKGFKMDLGIGVTPLYFKFDSKKGWGFGMSFLETEATGILALSGKMLSFDEVKDEESDLSGAVFTSVAVDAFFHIQKFKVKIRPAMYYPIAYMETDLLYTFVNNEGTRMKVGFDTKVYTAFALDDAHEQGIAGSPGFDFSFGVEYPLAKEIGLTDKFSFLDFDVGLDFINIPILSSEMKNYMRMYTIIDSGSHDVFDQDGMDDFLSALGKAESDSEFGVGSKTIERPFKMLLHANWRPLNGSQLFTVTPVLGFALSQLYLSPFSLEAGLNGSVNLANFFKATAGINYTDRIWINSIDLALNLRAVEFNIGADLRSQEFLKSWTANGLGLNFGFKFGW